MSPEQPAKLLRIHVSEADRHLGRPLFEALVEKCREMQISGATVFRGLEGFGETAGMHKSHLTWHDQPIVIVIVDSAENVGRLVEAAGGMIDTGLMAISDVRAIRVHKNSASGTEPGAD